MVHQKLSACNILVYRNNGKVYIQVCYETFQAIISGQEVNNMYKFCFYVPASHLEQVKQTVFNAGAGKIGNYDACCWQTKGQGQFRPLPESQPYLGEHEEITIVEEYKVEMVCEAKVIHAVLAAFRQAHPYETPAFDVFKLETFE